MALEVAPRPYDPVVWRFARVQLSLSQLQYATFTLIGIALLWPWNCYLSALAYYGDRFLHSPALVKIYSSTMMSVSTIALTTFNYFLSQKQKGANYIYRINTGLGLTIAIFVVMAFSCTMDLFIRMNDTVFFTGLMLMVLFSAMATCLAQNGTMATVNILGQLYTNAVMVGQAIAGTLPSIALILSIVLFGDRNHQGFFEPPDEASDDYYLDKNYGLFIYYITASLVSMASILLFALCGYLKQESLYQALSEIMEEGEGPNSGSAHVEALDALGDVQHSHVPFAVLWSKLKMIVMTIFFTFSITLCFPVFASVVESVHQDSEFLLFKKSIYIPFIYLVWNVGDLVGRILCGLANSKILIESPRILLFYSCARLAFIPLFLTCNIHPQGQGAIIPSDTWYILLNFLFGLSNGQLATSCFMIVGNHCDGADEKEAAGGFTTVFLSVGLAVGSVMSYFLVLVVG